GGFVTTNEPEIARNVRMIRDHGSETRYHHQLIGMNARLDEIQAVVLRAKLPHLSEWNRARRQHANLYGQLLSGTSLITPLNDPGNEPVYHLYVVQAPQRNELQAFLKDKGIFTGIHYPIPIHLQNSVAFLGYRPGDLPVTERVVGNILSLPMYAELEDTEIQSVASAIREFYQGTGEG
ncbi:MAG: DegT/DnrJ/EryC1/StrS family aminotransferase, partial [Anaerolineaceae bacterium]|nr:DegT/DnrJ/EryC1/StrS family aminotransferase [Anaerolineaceae bacterium]